MKPRPRLTAKSNDQRRGLVSSSSIDRSNDHMANVVVSVNATSGIKMRVKRKRPTEVARTIPARVPAFDRFPSDDVNAQLPAPRTSQHRATAASAIGILDTQSWMPNSK